MSTTLAYQLQRLLFGLWLRMPGSLRVRVRSIYRLWTARSWRNRRWPIVSVADQRAQAATRDAIICFPIVDWEMRVQRPHHLLTRLAARGYRIYYVRKDFKDGIALGMDPLAQGVTGVTLPAARAGVSIYAGAPTAEDVAAWMAALDRLRVKEGLERVTCLIQWPFWGPVALAARERWGWKVVYDCLDDHAGSRSASAALLALEEQLIRASDLVLATARSLVEKCRALNRRCELLPNAADFEHFHQPAHRRALPHVPDPIIGYYGALDRWFAAEFIAAAAVAHPGWHFVLIGLNSGADLRALSALRNVHLLGERPYGALPAYLERFAVATIPFRVNVLTNATNPLKFFEYLSAGKPVVATGLPELSPFKGLFYPAHSAAEFVTQLEVAVAERSEDLKAARVEVASRNTWDDRVAKLDGLFQELWPRELPVN